MTSAAPVVLGTDENGYIVREASGERIQREWAEPLGAVVARYRAHAGVRLHSVYVRGSVPLGRALPGISDIDTFAVVDGAGTGHDADWAEDHGRSIVHRWPFVAGVEMCMYAISAARTRGRVGAMISTQSVCVDGIDLTPEAGSYRPGVDLLFHGWDLPADLALARRILERSDAPRAVEDARTWAMKRVVRTGFELVMDREGCYTRDLVTCCERFGKHYPAKSRLMTAALELAMRGCRGGHSGIDVIDSLGPWLYAELCGEYGAARIEQLLRRRAG